jgi:hypothetical protein
MATRKRTGGRTIKSRKEQIRARKPKTLASILKGQTKLSKSFKESVGIAGALAGPGKFFRVAKSAKELAALKKGVPAFGKTLEKATSKATAARKASKSRKMIRDLEKRPALQRALKAPVKKGPDVRNPRTLAKGKDLEAQAAFKRQQAKLAGPTPGRLGAQAAKRDDLARAAARKESSLLPPGRVKGTTAIDPKSGRRVFVTTSRKSKGFDQPPLAPVPKGKLKKAPSFKAKRSKSGKSTRAKRK